jgi:hypothetical protein
VKMVDKNKLTYSIGFNHLIDTQNNWLCWSYKNDTRPYVSNTRTQHLWKNWMFDIWQFNHGGILQGLQPKVQFMSSIIGWVFGTSMLDNGGASCYMWDTLTFFVNSL